MTPATSRRLGALTGVALLAALAACAGDSRTEAPPPAPAARTTPTEPRLLAEEYVEGEALVQVVDPVGRRVILADAEGRSNTVAAPADVDLTRLKPGDRVLLGAYQSLSVRVLPPGSAPLGVVAAAGSTPPGQPRGRVWGERVIVVDEITALGLSAYTATLRGVDGRSRTIAVKDAEMRERMRNLQVGDLVELTYSEALAAKILPRR